MTECELVYGAYQRTYRVAHESGLDSDWRAFVEAMHAWRAHCKAAAIKREYANT